MQHNNIFFSIQNIKSNCFIIFLKLFWNIFSWLKIYFFPVISIYKKLNFCYSLWIFFWFLHDLMQLLKCIENICYLFNWWNLLLLFCFLSNQQNLYAIYHNTDFFYDICHTINEHNRKQTHYLSLIINHFDIYF